MTVTKPGFWWDVFLLLLYPVPVILGYVLFNTEKPIYRIFHDNEILIFYAILGVGTIAYLVLWIGIIVGYPESRRGRISAGWQRPMRLLSISGIVVMFMFCHAFGPVLAIWLMVVVAKKIVVWLTRLPWI